MKKIVLLIGILLCLCSCGSHSESRYEITIVYSIDGSEPKTEVVYMDFPSDTKPAYVYDGETLKVFGIHGQITSFDRKIIYSGSLDIEVKSFDYKVVREYRASNWDGHEIKPKK